MKKDNNTHTGKRWPLILIILCAFILLGISTAAVMDKIMSAKISRGLARQLESDINYIEIDGAEIAYRQMGNGTETILLVHGFMGSSYDFNLIMPELAKNYTVLAVDQIGFGLSDKSPQLNYAKSSSADILRKMMRSLNIERYHLLGHSMGGEVAMHMALKSPDDVERLILVDSAGLEDLQNGIKGELPGWMIDQVLQNYLLQRLVFFRTVYDNSLANSENFADFFYFNKQIPAATLNRIIADNDGGSLSDRLDEIRQTTLVIWGRHDKIIPLEQGLSLDQHLADSRIVIIENCGHLPFLEQPAELTREIIKFLHD